MEIDFDEQKQEFYRVCRANIHRDGIEELLEWLENADFFEAPASTKYHGAYPCGLCQHSLDVFEYALKLLPLCDTPIDRESLAIATLFHDLCKVNFYRLGWRTVKKDGRMDQQPVYTVEEKFPFGGHGAKSVFLAERHMHLTDEEAMAINCHMGFSNCDEHMQRSISSIYKLSPLAWITHVADEAATFLLER